MTAAEAGAASVPASGVPASAVPASGVQYEVSGGGYEAVLGSVGATLRSVSFHGRPLLASFEADEVRPGMRGALLAPWPNRLADGRYEFDGVEHQLTLSDPVTATALHGLAAWTDFSCVRWGSGGVALRGRIEPQTGYPWRLRLDVEVSVSAGGMRQRITATNESTRRAPIGLGVHPYLVVGAGADAGAASAEGDVDGWRLSMPATDVMLVSEDRMLPLGVVDLAERPDLDFTAEREIGDAALNHAYAGAAGARLTDARGHGVEMGWDEGCAWVQLYSDDLDEPGRRRSALAVEPMTCPPDAFSSGIDLRVLAPGESTSLEWWLRAVS
ncbi:galactose mutarotase [Cnuibacter physcomitrellae]|uniref:aldose 1-epimerase family protein n=1 Tax=Cnuibacter physcomitrellae TaxID=1619308 RepID=UPI0019C03985|nr:aldose 1-epimerase family protein [Cnuibacter physcomitrellae]GGI40075.1 galactose mutarotase [Cnuibacter physcomitrellae]